MTVGREERVPVAGARLWTVAQGTGPPLVMAHGGPALCDNLGPVAAMVDDLVTVHRYDQRACGRSTGDGEGQDVASAVADLEALRQHLGHDRWLVGGHSWGASLALFYAMAHPERVRGVVHLSGPGVTAAPDRPRAPSREERLTEAERARLSELRRRSGWGDRAVDEELARLYWRSDFADPVAAPDFHTEPMYAYPRNVAAAAALRASARERVQRRDFLPALRHLDVPVLVVHGREDPVPIEPAEELAAMLPRAELRRLPGVGHSPWLERPWLLRRVLRAWLASHG